MRRVLILLPGTLLALTITTAVLAESSVSVDIDTSIDSSRKNTIQERRSTIIDTSKNIRDINPNLLERRDSRDNQVRVASDKRATRAAIRSRRHAALKDKHADMISRRRDRIAAKKASHSSEMQQKHDEFRAKKAQLTDQRKQQILDKLNNKYPQINERWTNHFFQVLDRLEEILAKLEDRGADITNAQQTVDSARTAVENQAASEYIISIGNDTTLRQDAKSTHDQLKKDLFSTRDLIKESRKSVHDVFQTLKNENTNNE